MFSEFESQLKPTQLKLCIASDTTGFDAPAICAWPRRGHEARGESPKPHGLNGQVHQDNH